MHSWNHEAMRLGDRERRQALKALDKHHARGRIDAAEHAERTDAIASARTLGDLRTVFADLGWGSRPAYAYGWAGPVRSRRRPSPLVALLPLLLVVGIVLAALGHVPWLPVIVVGALVLLIGPHRSRRRHWFGHRGYAC